MGLPRDPLPQCAPSVCQDNGLSAYACVRPRLFGIACRILKSASEAEDVLQEVWLRWQATERSTVHNPSAFLATATARLCINVTQSARVRRELCVQELPAVPAVASDPGMNAQHEEALQSAALLLVETLSTREQRAYVLREAFDYSYREIAGMLQMREANARQLVSRARKRIAVSQKSGIPRDRYGLLSNRWSWPVPLAYCLV